MQYIRIQKVATAPMPDKPPGDPCIYAMGQLNPGISLPIDYWMEGWLQIPITLGGRVLLHRRVRNGVEQTGIFISSPIIAIHNEREFSTANSKYHWHPVPAGDQCAEPDALPLP